VLLIAAPASAHVTARPDTTAAGAYALVTFGVPHGCEGSSTTRVSIEIPDALTGVTPTVNPGWDVEMTMETLDPPVEGSHGEEITERVAEVVYTARTPLPDELRDAFVLSLKLPEDAAGDTLVFPTVQACEEGEAAWVEVAGPGEDPDDLDYPAPAFEVTAAEDDGHSHGGGEHATDDAAGEATTTGEAGASDEVELSAEAAAQVAPDDAAPAAVTWVALAIGAAGLAAGAAGLLVARSALARARRDT
jgi:uncharacterized protein YcnI